MKLIFLDIDGVLNTEHGLKTITNNWTELNNIERDEYGHSFCEKACRNLEIIIKMTGAKIVISSTWRLSGLKIMQEMWKARGLAGEIIDVTPITSDGVRGNEIDKWLKSKNYYYPISDWDSPAWEEKRAECEIENYVIIDDDRDMLLDQADHFVHTPAYHGLSDKKKMAEVISILNKK